MMLKTIKRVTTHCNTCFMEFLHLQVFRRSINPLIGFLHFFMSGTQKTVILTSFLKITCNFTSRKLFLFSNSPMNNQLFSFQYNDHFAKNINLLFGIVWLQFQKINEFSVFTFCPKGFLNISSSFRYWMMSSDVPKLVIVRI